MRSHLYRQCAVTCISFASDTNDIQTKLELLDMAQAWAKLADQAKKNSRFGSLHETPRQHPSPAH